MKRISTGGIRIWAYIGIISMVWMQSVCVAAPLALSLTAHPDNTLMALADIETDSGASVYIEFSADNVAAHRTAATEVATRHEIVVAGMRAQTTYSLKAVALFEDGTRKTSEPLSFTTGDLPQGAPAVTLVTNRPESAGGVTLFGISPENQEESDTPVYWGVDEEGMIVWYLHGDSQASGSPFIRRGAPGEFLAFHQDSIWTINSAGETLGEYDLLSAVNYHHDAAILPNGNVMALVSETGTFDNELLAGDRIVELSPDGQVVWEWSAFEHLDTTRFPGSLSRNKTRNGGLDWSHANALHYIADEDALLLSLRSQNWVVKIDHATGKILWIMGEDTDTAQGFEANFFTLTAGSWMTSQHAPFATSNGEILLYDNRNDSNGSSLNSRAVKYALDESTMTAVQTWESTAPKYTFALGDVDELFSKNILICAGGPSGFTPDADSTAHILEVTADTPSETIWEITVGDSIYRAERLSWADFLGGASLRLHRKFR